MPWDKTVVMHKKGDSASPTVSLEATMITYAIEAHEIKEVDRTYILTAYLHMYPDKEVIIILKGRLTLLLTTTEPKIYRKYVVIERGVK